MAAILSRPQCVMVWRRTDDEPLLEPKLIQFYDAIWCHWATMNKDNQCRCFDTLGLYVVYMRRWTGTRSALVQVMVWRKFPDVSSIGPTMINFSGIWIKIKIFLSSSFMWKPLQNVRRFVRLDVLNSYISSVHRYRDEFRKGNIEIVATGCTGCCHIDNFRCSQWRKFRLCDISVSVAGLSLFTNENTSHHK